MIGIGTAAERGRGNVLSNVISERSALDCMNNTAWQNARKQAALRYAEKVGREAPAGFANVRVH